MSAILRCRFFLPGFFWVFVISTPLLAETVTVDGVVHENAEIADVGEAGIIYQTSDGGRLVVPWAQMNDFQKTAVKTRFSKAIENVRLKAIWVEGTVFENTRDGVVVQISIDLKVEDDSDEEEKDSPELEYRDGGEVAKGMVIVKDLKDSAVKKPGDPVSGIFYKKGTYTYEVGGFNLIKEIPLCTQAQPEWARARQWTNREGNQLAARVIAVKDGKCLFEQNGKTFPYEIARLTDEDQALVKEFEERSRAIPVF